jgi:hypothetical protein
MRSCGIRCVLLPLWMVLLLVTSCVSFCAAQSKEENVKEFLTCLKANKEQKIYDISFHVNRKNYITDNELRKRYVAMASEALNKYLISPERMWDSLTFPDQSRTLFIPLIAGRDSAVRANIVLSFPPATISDKVYDFQIDINNSTGGKVTAPLRVH